MKIFNTALLLAALAFLPSCYRVPLYKTKSLHFLNNDCPYTQTEQNIIVKARLLDQYDKRELFGEYSKKLIDTFSREPILVIYFSISNLSTHSYILPYCNGIDLKFISYEHINSKLKTSTRLRTAGTILATYGTCSCLAVVSGITTCLPILIAVSIGGILSTIPIFQLNKSANESKSMNNKIAEDLEIKTFQKTIIIPSEGFYEGLFFVKESDFKSQFTLELQEKKTTSKIKFDIAL